MTEDPLKRCLELLAETEGYLRKLGLITPPPGPAQAPRSNRPKLTPREVLRIQYMRREGVFNNAELARMFDVNPSTISRINSGVYHRSTK